MNKSLNLYMKLMKRKKKREVYFVYRNIISILVFISQSL